MLIKLMKYELKATSRTLLPAYGAILIFAFISKLLIDTDLSGFPVGLSVLGYIMVVIASFILTFVIIIQRFYKNLLGDEGYLMFTLPVRSSALILSKLFVSVIWLCLSTVVMLLSIIIFAGTDNIEELVRGFVQVYNQIIIRGYYREYVNVEMVISTIISLFSGVLMVYAAITLGHLAKNHKLLLSFGAYLALSFITQLITLVIAYNFVPLEGYTGEDLSIITPIVLNALYMLAYYFIAQRILARRLNLE